MKLEKTKVELEIYGEKVAMKLPTYKEATEYRTELNALPTSSDAAEVIKKFLVAMGLPEAMFDQLEMNHVTEVLEFILAPKKK